MNTTQLRVKRILAAWNPRLASLTHEPRVAAYYINMELLNWQLRDLNQYQPDKNTVHTLEPL